MSDTAIRIEGIGKQYRIGTAQAGMFQYRSLRDSLGGFAKRPWNAFKNRGKLTDDNSFWALKDVSFEVKKGEVVGIIGRNGAGKSTLLKILSRITKPTTGHIELHGRVGSLLEVGTGFHPELTGRENIYLNGAILGMTRAEVKAKFDEIVAFSEIERFLDTPVKQYSSGMYTRLAFAVAAHLEPEILVVDEVLAVGDAGFQKKCLGKMKDVAGEGRTVLFVSHNMAAVRSLCDGGALLDEGRLVEVGDTIEITSHYLSRSASEAQSRSFSTTELTVELNPVNVHVHERSVDIQLAGMITVHSRKLPVGLGLVVTTVEGAYVTKLLPRHADTVFEGTPGAHVFGLTVHDASRYLMPGEYSIGVNIYEYGVRKLIECEVAANFTIPDVDVYASGNGPSAPTHGIVPLPVKLLVVPV